MKIDLWTIHRAECPDCGCEFLVHGDPRPKDRMSCPMCKKKMTVGDICGDFRPHSNPTTLETQQI